MLISLNTGRIIHRKQWKKLLITQKIIDRVEQLGDKENQPYVSSDFKYKWDTNNTDERDWDIGEVSDNGSVVTNTVKAEDTPLIEFHEIADKINETAMERENIEDARITHDDKDNQNTKERNDKIKSNDNPAAEIPTPDEFHSNVMPEPNINIEDPMLNENRNEDNEDLNSEGSNCSVNSDPSDPENEDKEDNEKQTLILDEVVDDGDVNTNKGGRYNLRSRNSINYCTIHNYSETQLMQIQNEWITKNS